MVTTFEEHSCDLNEEDIANQEDIKNAFKNFLRPGIKVKAKDLREQINYHLSTGSKDDYKLTDIKLRRWTNYLRSAGMIPILASSEGYFISFDKEVIKLQILSLRERANSINQAADGLLKYTY